MEIAVVMTPCDKKIDSHATLEVALKMMAENHIRHLPVMVGDVVIGLLNKSAAVLCFTVNATMKNEVLVGAICDREMLLVAPETDAAQVILEMAQKKLDSVLVGRSSKDIVGIFTVTDACRLAHNLLEEKRYRK